jgi:hypothetical protein
MFLQEWYLNCTKTLFYQLHITSGGVNHTRKTDNLNILIYVKNAKTQRQFKIQA